MIGERVNNYQIISLLGEGGMGAVYLAEHPFMGRKAAIKVLRREFAEDRGLVDRFMNEARAANAIRHANIIDIIDVGRLPSGIPYLMMEFLDGESLAKRITTLGRLSVAEAVDITVQTATALSAAHAKGIVHRDLKPDNLFLLPDDSRPGGQRVKVLDFGIAKLRGDLNGAAAKTQSGSLMGTPPYMSPEQCRGLPDEIDERTDIYALGIILYELLCGAPPFVSPGWGDIVLMHITQAPAPPRSRNPEIPPAVEGVILKALAKERDQRFGSMQDMQTALRIAMQGVVAAPTAPTIAAAAAVPRPDAPTGSPSASSKPTTTFRTGTGEVVSTLRGHSAPAISQRRSRTYLLAAVAGVLILGAGGLMFSKRQAPPAVLARAIVPAPVMVKGPAPGPAAVAQAEPPPPKPAVAKFALRVVSIPGGASVADAKSGKILGSTPLEQKVEGTVGTWDVRLAKDGFAPADLSIALPLRENVDRTVTLEHVLPDGTRRDSRVVHDRQHKPVKLGSRDAPAAQGPRAGGVVSGVAPAVVAPPLAPPAAAPVPAARPKPAAEKW